MINKAIKPDQTTQDHNLYPVTSLFYNIGIALLVACVTWCVLLAIYYANN